MTVNKTKAGAILTDIVLMVFRLEGGFMEAAERIAAPAGLTAARWRVLGAVLHEHRTVAEIGRFMGLTRQSVQRLADVLVGEGLAMFIDNPSHKSAKLLAPTAAGHSAVALLATRQAAWANAVSQKFSAEQLIQCKTTIEEIISCVEATPISPGEI
ncbi:MarR family winged helix-turn-helix transcriptional regulator [Cupriavidus sp. YAF13]|uniref:MarR family winged helix-turn-helix transcriptional regulator n=1 Tax=Cupriavidus sp. YAF13 TaxID=3233075 RepID=UPI003F8E3E0D